MSNKVRQHNILIFSIIAVIAVAVFVGVWFINSLLYKPDITNSIVLTGENNAAQLKCIENKKNNTYYFYIPAGETAVSIQSAKNYTVEIETLSSNKRLPISSLKIGEAYNASIRKKGGIASSFKLAFLCSENVPALFISTESGSMEYINAKKGNHEKGSFKLFDSNAQQLVQGEITELEGRGNTSWTDCDKKGYKFQTDKAVAPLGLVKSDNWILVANARSNYLSNSLAFWLEEQIGIKNVTHARFVDVYFNGEYHGNYILCERIHVGENSIDIDDLEAENLLVNEGKKVKNKNKYVSPDGSYKAYLWANNPENITGGYLIERDVPEYYADEVSGFVLSSGDHYVLKSPQFASAEEVRYIKEYWQDFYDALSSESGYNQKGKYYTEYIDVDSFALKYVLEEFLAFNDAGRSSAYYYKERNGLLYAGPGWDFEGAFLGNSQYLTKLNGTYYSTDLYEQLMAHKDFEEKVKENYRSLLRPAVVQMKDIIIDRWQAELSASVQMDEMRWDRDVFQQYILSNAQVKSWVEQRVEFLDSQWLSNEVFVSLKIVNSFGNNAYVYLKPGEAFSKEKSPLEGEDGFLYYADESGNEIAFGTVFDEDTVIYAVYQSNGNSMVNRIISAGKLIVPEIVFAGVFIAVFIVFFIKTRKREGGKK